MFERNSCEVTVVSTLRDHGWNVKLQPAWLGAHHAFSPDIVAEKNGFTVAIECKLGSATITDVAMLRKTPVQKRVVVADEEARSVSE